MKIKILLILMTLLAACSPNNTNATQVPIPSSPAAEPTGETSAPTLTPTQPDPEPTATHILQTLVPSMTATLSGLMPTEMASSDNLIMNKIMVSFSKGPHADKMRCERCHFVEVGLITRKLAWVDENAGQVDDISEPKQICLKCHDYLSTESPVMLVHPGFECTYCHDAHRPQPTCAASACH